jgi:hypothetical protein
LNVKLIETYLKVKALAESGASGEKGAAQATMSKMEQQNPGLRAAAEAHVRGQAAAKAAAEYPDPFPGSRRSPAGTSSPGQGQSTGNWENIFKYAQGFYETVKEVVEDVSDAYYGKVLVDEEVEFSAGVRDRVVTIRVRIPFETLGEARALNALQKDSFRQAMHAEMDEYIDGILQVEKKAAAKSGR